MVCICNSNLLWYPGGGPGRCECQDMGNVDDLECGGKKEVSTRWRIRAMYLCT